MKSRQEIKWLAKQAFQNRYWPCVGALVIYQIVTYALAFSGLGTLILGGPLLIGFNFYFVNVFMHGGCELAGAFSKAFEDFGRKLGGYLWMQLFVFLWALIPIGGVFVLSLLAGILTAAAGSAAVAVAEIFVIVIAYGGGMALVIIKLLSYSLTTYILCDCPNVRAQDALTLSKRLMSGHKGELFVFHLSFIGLDLLNCLTFGLLGIFYVNPYKQAALAGWYLELREQALRDGTVTADELNGGTLRENASANGNGYNSNGYNSNGYNPNGYNPNGYNPNGYNPNGYNPNGYNPNGYNPNGYNPNGYNPNGYNPNGYNPNGYNPNGYNPNGYNPNNNDQNQP